ncbi:MAG TPA: glucuronyl hydrolase [Mariniphaga anaerophila]|uniref:Glucuronyl hydrolase n=1 Tax=Mariniphaga anaerophila TaxID=1484053 RepID=A0A831LI36_9BACT|nr:glucuronyl hydrolase [Mariniphaga anaerophila]
MLLLQRKTQFKILALLFFFLISACSRTHNFEKKIITHSEAQMTLLLSEIQNFYHRSPDSNEVSPRTLDADGNLVMVKSKDWTSGFFPGVLWLLYELTGKETWKNHARDFTKNLEQEKNNGSTHDMGFKIYCSFGNSYRLTGDTRSRKIVIESAYTLAKRFNPSVGCIRSWDHNRDKWSFPVIIDNMMNLELLFSATRLTGDPTFREIAVIHANTTMENHFREDFGTWHVVDYHPDTGQVIKKNTHQGYNHDSTWSRGEAWALYGFTLCYRETRDKRYLEQAENIASFILNHPNLPDDLVPYWDFDAPNIPDEPRDVSAASIMASAFYELSRYSKNGSLYKRTADSIMSSIINGYMSRKKEAKGFILKHSTGSAPSGSEVDVPLIYSDYYFLEALIRAMRLEKGDPVI